MNNRLHLSCAGALLGLALCAPAQVVVSEINFTPLGMSNQWIELFYSGSSPVDLSQWSLYYATNTVGEAGTYWFAVPSGTALAPASFLRVHWREDIPVGATPGEVYTGTSIFHFLFGYYPEPLLVTSGAVAIFNTQDNALMNRAESIVDWVSWGESGLPREDLAVEAGLWNQGAFALAPRASDSVALNYNANIEPTPPNAFFRDASPTPMGHNHMGDASVSFGTPCTFGSLPAPTISNGSVPAGGNRDFTLVINDTIMGGTWLFFGSGQANPPIKPPLPGPCEIFVDVPIATLPVLTVPGTTTIRLPLVAVSGGISLYIQTFTAFDPTNHAFSNGLQLDLGL